MKNTAQKILEALERNGELSLEQIAALIPKKFGDHRDFYIFACLVTAGYIDDDRLIDDENPDPNRSKEQLLAREYFASSTADQTAKYENFTWSRHGGVGLKDQKFALSGSGSLYLTESRAKRFDRLFALSSGIVVGILVAIVGAYLRGCG